MNQTHFWVTAVMWGSTLIPLPKREGGDGRAGSSLGTAVRGALASLTLAAPRRSRPGLCQQGLAKSRMSETAFKISSFTLSLDFLEVSPRYLQGGGLFKYPFKLSQSQLLFDITALERILSNYFKIM